MTVAVIVQEQENILWSTCPEGIIKFVITDNYISPLFISISKVHELDPFLAHIYQEYYHVEKEMGFMHRKMRLLPHAHQAK